MLLNKQNKEIIPTSSEAEETNENLENGKELLGSFNQKIPVLETSSHEYKVVVKETKKDNLLFS